jgi:hypothetical protein
MKRNTLLKLLAIAFLFVLSCRKEQYLAPSISGTSSDTVVLNIGDKIVLAPDITNLKGNNYVWLVNGKEMVSGQINYTFEAKESGNFDVVLKIKNKGGADEHAFKIFVEKPINISINEELAVPMCSVLEINPTVTGPDRNDYEYEWLIGDSVIGKNANLNFISAEAGTYELTFKATAGKQTTTATRTITVSEKQYVRNAYTVLEYLPSPANGHNWSIIGNADLWKYGNEHPLAYNDFLAKATELRKENEGDGLVLGSWGGSATFKFDHTVANVFGKPDIELTATYSQLDPPTAYAAYDRNKNGQPDEDEWYEIKNADYGLEDMQDYAITFTYDSTTTDDRRIYSYFNWKDNQPEPAGGQILTRKTFSSSTTTDGLFSTKGFFPGLNMMDISSKQVAFMDGWSASFSRKGKRVTKNFTRVNTFYQKMNIDIDLAVDSNGSSVQLPGIDFIKIMKVVYPFEQDFINSGGEMKDSNMDEARMLHVFSILDKHLKN